MTKTQSHLYEQIVIAGLPAHLRLSPFIAMLHIQNEMTKAFPFGRIKG